jgi:hypothetical protein
MPKDAGGEKDPPTRSAPNMAARKFNLGLNLKDAHDLGIDVPGD